ncbi:MAG: CinA family protein [Firmicutes bacterium]|nr:CinA family protein [Candidatus Fiminaster equi]
MKKLLKHLDEKGLTLGSVESMTGGLFAGEFTSIPGSSKVFKGSVVTYATEIKEKVVGVKAETIEKFGVVSVEVAREMAECGRKLLNVDVCVAVTGNAGPTCEPGGKPAGFFCVAVSTKDGTSVETFKKMKKRNGVRNSAVLAMRDLVYLKTI